MIKNLLRRASALTKTNRLEPERSLLVPKLTHRLQPVGRLVLYEVRSYCKHDVMHLVFLPCVVSILYEVRSYCKLRGYNRFLENLPVSILYEVRSYCKCKKFSSRRVFKRFNPLRGSKLLQACSGFEKPVFVGFQSSTRFEVIASDKEKVSKMHAVVFNPLRGSKLLQVFSAKAVKYVEASFNPLRGSKLLQGSGRLARR